MDSFFIALNSVIPIVILVGFGYFLKEAQYFDDSLIKKLNKLCFNFLIPVATFNNIYKTDIKHILDPYFLLYAGGTIILVIPLLMLFIPYLEKDKKKQGVLIQGIFRSNFIILGLPLSSYIAGANSAALASMLVMVIIPLFNGSAVFLLSLYGGHAVSKKQLIRNILKNRMIQASIVGVVFSFLQIRFPHSIDRPLSDIGKIGGIFPMIVLGAMLDFSKVSRNTKPLTIALLGKLIIMPALFLSIAVFIGFEQDKLVALIALYGAPTAVISVIMAQQLDCDYELAAQIVVFSTVLSCFSIFTIVFSLSFLGIL